MPYQDDRRQQAQTPQGMDFSGQGVGEQVFQNQQAGWQAPTQSGQVARQGIPQLQQGQTRAADAYDTFKAGPQDFSPYYDRAKERTLGSMNDQAAARGAYGSSQTMNNLQDASVAIDAEQANREAQYNLQRAGVAGQLGASADQQGLNRFGMQGQLAGQADASEMNRMQGYQSAALGAQDARRARGRDYVSDIYQPSMAAAGLTQQAMQQMLDYDNQMMDAIAALELGAASQGLEANRYQDQQIRGDISSDLALTKWASNPIM